MPVSCLNVFFFFNFLSLSLPLLPVKETLHLNQLTLPALGDSATISFMDCRSAVWYVRGPYCTLTLITASTSRTDVSYDSRSIL